MTRRNIELLLMFVAGIIIMLLFGTLVLNKPDIFSISSLIVPAGIIGAFLVAHFAIRK